MKRRDFVKNTALTVLGASLVGPLDGLAEEQETHYTSKELSARTGKDNGFPLNFIAVGDWGRNGEDNQQEVAKQMGLWAGANPNDFVISVGDNFYPLGVVSENDPLWHYSFENIYTAHSLQCDWYPVLGNHDYGSDPEAQIRYSKVSRRWNMPAKYYAKEIALDNNKLKALLVFIDTDPMLHEAKKMEVDKQLLWINKTLSNVSANIKWKIVIGHHPYYTVGPRMTNEDTLTIRKKLAHVFETHKVDVYLSGHDHSLQHLKPDCFTNMFISGAGSELTQVSANIPYSKFQASENGFMYFSLNDNKLNVKAINMHGTVLYEAQLTK